MSAFVHQVVYEFRSGLRDRGQILMNYLFPLVFFALMGGLMSKVNPAFGETMVPGMSLFALMCASLLTAPSAIVTARDSGLLRSYRINGVPAWAALVAPPLANLVHMAIVTAGIALAGSLLFGASLPGDWAYFVLVWLAAWLALAGLGALVGCLAPNPRVALLMSQLFYIPSIVLGGLMMPASVLPPALGRLSLVLPASHAMRAFVDGPGTEASLWALLALAAGAVSAFGMALALYEWDQKNARSPAWKSLGLLALLPYVAVALFS